jgi:riboflavin synthase
MFTGIIQHVGVVQAVSRSTVGLRVRIDLGPVCEGLQPGQSIAVNGLCLTAARRDPPAGEFDVVAESLSRSTLGDLRPGSRVNLEPALPADGRFDGHIVQGHVDGIARVADVRRGGDWRTTFTAPPETLGQMVPKGSVAIDGVSLTLADVTDDGFSVALIPTTLGETTLAELAVGQAVHVETDILGKYVQRTLRTMLEDGASSTGGLTLDTLRDAGFA